MPILNIICWRPFWKLPWPDGRSRNSTECTTFSVMILGIERHILLLSQLEMNEKNIFTYTLIYMYNDDNDTKKKFFFLHFSRCGYIRLLSALIPDDKYVNFLLVNRKCKMLRLASALLHSPDWSNPVSCGRRFWFWRTRSRTVRPPPGARC